MKRLKLDSESWLPVIWVSTHTSEYGPKKLSESEDGSYYIRADLVIKLILVVMRYLKTIHNASYYMLKNGLWELERVLEPYFDFQKNHWRNK